MGHDQGTAHGDALPEGTRRWEEESEMAIQTFGPSAQYWVKLRWTLLISVAISLAICLAIAIPVGLNAGGNALWIGVLSSLAANLAWLVPSWFLAQAYYCSLGYQILEDEAIVQVGVWTKSVKHVPYRTVTNLQVKRDILDRPLSIGTLNIQTAGMSGTTGAEESLVGLSNYQAVYEQVASALRRYRGAMPPTAAGEEIAAPEGAVLTQILTEVRAIRQRLEER